MQSIRQKNTKPELLVRRLLHGLGYRFRLHQQTLPGRPDIVLPRHHVAVQVHGCFWHQHSCKLSNVPRTRQDYWLPKLAGNVKRDKKNNKALRRLGWRVLTVWECELVKPEKVSKKLARFIQKRKHKNAALGRMSIQKS